MNMSNQYDVDSRRHIPVKGAYNIRDLGGYPTVDGRQTRWRTLFRADGISDLPASSQATLVNEGVKTIVDLRGSRELSEEPSVFKDLQDVGYRSHNIAGDTAVSDWGDRPIPDDSSIRLSTLYTAIIDKRGNALKGALQTLAEPGALPALFHCTAGKDRTGVVSALLLGIAGVPDETIVEDYALSARFLYGTPVVPPPVLDGGPPLAFEAYQLKWAPPGAMEVTLRHLDDTYGGVIEYVRHIGVTDSEIDSIKDALVE
jgi:protein-tyrosine phosphatase